MRCLNYVSPDSELQDDIIHLGPKHNEDRWADEEKAIEISSREEEDKEEEEQLVVVEVEGEELVDNGDKIPRQEDETREDRSKVIERLKIKKLSLVDYDIVPCVADTLNIPKPKKSFQMCLE